jgi:hypothetical protein
MSDEYISPRVNSARIKDFMDASHPVRVTGKVLNVRPFQPLSRRGVPPLQMHLRLHPFPLLFVTFHLVFSV